MIVHRTSYDMIAAESKELMEKLDGSLTSVEKEKKYTSNNADGKSHFFLLCNVRERPVEPITKP